MSRPSCHLPLLLLACGLAASHAPARAAVPAGFTDTLLTSGVGEPTALAFAPDGRLLITGKQGTVYVYQDGALVATPVLTIPTGSICGDGERGLLGIAVDPAFASAGENYVYLYYTHEDAGGCDNRVSRFLLTAGNTISYAGEQVLLDNIDSPGCCHNAGDVEFGRDGNLYVTVGDGGPATNGQLRHNLNGKVLRITRSGAIPAGNPFTGAGTARCNSGPVASGTICQEIFAWGFRNPFRFGFDPNAVGTRFFVNDVGQSTWEEIDDVVAGGNYGWNLCEGNHNTGTTNPCTNAPGGHHPPVFEWQHGTQAMPRLVPGLSTSNCHSITGGAFVPDGAWADSGGGSFDGDFFFGDVTCQIIARLSHDGTAWVASDFGTSLGQVVHLEFGPFGNGTALYYTRITGEVRRISRDNPAGNDPPTAVIGASPTFGAVPLTVDFSAAGTTDPDPGDTLTYFWDFGDGSPVVETTAQTVQHVYTVAGTYQAQLRARDASFVFSAPVTIQIQPGNTPPVPTIVSPTAGSEYGVGETISLVASGTDAQDDTLPASAFSWTVLRRHAAHTHPEFGPVSGNSLSFPAQAPEALDAVANTYLEIYLTATDSEGLQTVVQRDIHPDRVDVTFVTEPAGLDLRLVLPSGTTSLTGPQTIGSWRGWALPLEAPSQEVSSTLWVFASWSDGGAAAHTIVTPASPAVYTATFEASVTDGPHELFTVTPCRVVDTRGPTGATGGPALASGQVRTFTLTGTCNVPATARAVAVNATAVTPSAQGFVALYPAGLAGTGTSVLSFTAGRTRANNAVLLLGDGDAVAARAEGATVHLLIDVVGYFE